MGTIPYGEQTQIIAINKIFMESASLSIQENLDPSEVYIVNIIPETGYISELKNMRIRINANNMASSGYQMVRIQQGNFVASMKANFDENIDYILSNAQSGTILEPPLIGDFNNAVKNLFFDESVPLSFNILNAVNAVRDSGLYSEISIRYTKQKVNE